MWIYHSIDIIILYRLALLCKKKKKKEMNKFLFICLFGCLESDAA